VRAAATPAGAIRALRAVRAFAARCALSDDHTDRLALVVDEWLANALEHGRPPAESQLLVRLTREPTCVRLVITDAGAPFDPRTTVFEGPDLERGGGVGLELVRAWAEIDAYRRHRGRNHVTLRIPCA
jgi:anti-sigma regulatory factor (Ser/Thr protein kinase)